MIYMTEHEKSDMGWYTVRSAPADSPAWGPSERGWLRWMLDHGSDVVTVGCTMYVLSTADEA